MNGVIHDGQSAPPWDRMKDMAVQVAVWATVFCWLPDSGAAWAAPVTPATRTLIAIATSARAGQPLEPHP